jgi:dipeptidyl-peptidase 4
LNRHQNHLEILLADAASGKTRILYEETNNYYIEITNDLTFLNDGKHFIITSELSGYNHIYLYDLNGKLIRPLTSGNWDVTNFYGVDPKLKTASIIRLRKHLP